MILLSTWVITKIYTTENSLQVICWHIYRKSQYFDIHPNKYVCYTWRHKCPRIESPLKLVIGVFQIIWGVSKHHLSLFFGADHFFQDDFATAFIQAFPSFFASHWRKKSINQLFRRECSSSQQSCSHRPEIAWETVLFTVLI